MASMPSIPCNTVALMSNNEESTDTTLVTSQKAARSAKVTGVPSLSHHPVYIDYADKDMSWVAQSLGCNVHPSMVSLLPSHLCSRSSMGPTATFPNHLHQAVEVSSVSTEHESVVRWLPHGRAFKVYNRLRFVQEVLPKFLVGQGSYSSFQRQLHHYGFFNVSRTDASCDERGAYYHPLFLRGQPKLCHLLVRLPPPQRRQRDAGSRPHKRQRLDPHSEPDLNRLPPMQNRHDPRAANLPSLVAGLYPSAGQEGRDENWACSLAEKSLSCPAFDPEMTTQLGAMTHTTHKNVRPAMANPDAHVGAPMVWAKAPIPMSLLRQPQEGLSARHNGPKSGSPVDSTLMGALLQHRGSMNALWQHHGSVTLDSHDSAWVCMKDAVKDVVDPKHQPQRRHDMTPSPTRDILKAEWMDNMGIFMPVEDAMAACDPNVYRLMFDSTK